MTTLIEFSVCIILCLAYIITQSHHKITKANTMSFFNAIQIALLIAAGPILLGLLKGATFAFATPLFWLLAIVYVGLFIWNIFMIADSIGK